MKIVMIGAGRVAVNLAPALVRSGVEVVEVWSKTRASAEALAERIGSLAQWGDFNRLTHDADLYLLAVKDTALADTVKRLHLGREQALFAHTSGSMPISLFADAGHARGGVFYPLQTFSKERQVDFSTVHFFVEGSQKADEKLLTALANDLTGERADYVHLSTTASRRQLHLAAVFACNYANHCCTLAHEILQESGLDFDVMLSLIDETVNKLHELSPRQAQTGPAARHDENVMGMHRAMLAHHPELQRIYSMMAESIMKGT